MEPFPDVRTLIPHSGRSCLLDTVLHFGSDGAWCRASIRADHPYLTRAKVHPLLAIELFAQTAAVHRALAEMGSSPATAGGQLVAADVEMQGTPLEPPCELLVQVVPGATFGQMTKFSGELYQEGPVRVLLARGEVSVAAEATP